jgi:glycosyltransferase involved in cell wall biosynthesis
VVLAGTVTDEDLAGWYHAADALCFPSVKEGWGLAVLEALAAGLPVLASDLPVFREYLVDGVSALLPPVGDADGITAAMVRLVDDPELRQRLVEGGRAILPRYTWSASAARHREVYADLLAQVPG